MRHLAMTGIETAAMISRIFLGEAMRATPPSARICAGTRSRAITETAPDFSAMTACSAVVTSITTPPLSISARPVLRRRLLELPLFWDIEGSFLVGAKHAGSCLYFTASRLIDHEGPEEPEGRPKRDHKDTNVHEGPQFSLEESRVRLLAAKDSKNIRKVRKTKKLQKRTEQKDTPTLLRGLGVQSRGNCTALRGPVHLFEWANDEHPGDTPNDQYSDGDCKRRKKATGLI